MPTEAYSVEYKNLHSIINTTKKYNSCRINIFKKSKYLFNPQIWLAYKRLKAQTEKAQDLESPMRSIQGNKLREETLAQKAISFQMSREANRVEYKKLEWAGLKINTIKMQKHYFLIKLVFRI